MSLLAAPETVPFGVASLLVLLICAIEVGGLMTVGSPSSMLDAILPESTGNDLLGWLHLGRVPVLVLLVLFLGSFAAVGYGLQFAMRGLAGVYLPAAVAGIVSLPVAILAVRRFGRTLGRLVPVDETSSVSEQSLIGRIATISNGSARRGLAAQARIRDQHGRTHFIMVEPDIDDDVFEEGRQVLIVRKAGPFYRCIANPHASLA